VAVITAAWTEGRSVGTADGAVEYAASFWIESLLLVTTDVVVHCWCAWHFGWRGKLAFTRGDTRAVTVT